tara:strand:+ start:169 stop:582 length:414 start_codon:yes stop_codon:yes gene_type:complete
MQYKDQANQQHQEKSDMSVQEELANVMQLSEEQELDPDQQVKQDSFKKESPNRSSKKSSNYEQIRPLRIENNDATDIQQVYKQNSNKKNQKSYESFSQSSDKQAEEKLGCKSKSKKGSSNNSFDLLNNEIHNKIQEA